MAEWCCKDAGDSGALGRKWAHVYAKMAATVLGGDERERYEEGLHEARDDYDGPNMQKDNGESEERW